MREVAVAALVAVMAWTIVAHADETVVAECGKTDVVIVKKAPPAVKFAAKELSGFLSRAFGEDVPIVNEPKDGRTALILGENDWSKEAGIDPGSKPRDTFFIKTAPGRVYLVGRDHKTCNPETYGNLEGFERATSFAVYGFLEKFAGCRFYFPGELGEIVPRTSRIEVPPTDLASTPTFLVRRYYNSKSDGKWYDDGVHAKDGKRLNWLRLKMATASVPCCHGTAYMKFRQRFAETHPEYFALRSDGSRCTNYTGVPSSRNGHLCFSNPGMRQAMFEECVARFSKGASYVDIMPNDSYPECMCKGCQAMYRHSDKSNYASELIWDYTVDIANRLKKAGIKGKVTQMAYCPYRRIPDIEIPDNVEVMVAEGGPFSMSRPAEMQRQFDEIRAWSKKLGGRPVWIWTYPHKYGVMQIPGPPDVTPRACGEYYKRISDAIFGTFAETETDMWIYHYLNYYVMSRVFWDATVDVDAVIKEHHRLMFGAGAHEMAEFYDILEDKWVKGIAGNVKDTAIGPVATMPSERDIWTLIYSSDVIEKLDSLLKAAAAKVTVDSMEARRIAFIRAQYYDPLAAAPQRWRNHVAEVEAFRWNMASGSQISLQPHGRRRPEPADVVKTTVSARRTSDALVFTFDCEEPNMNDVTSIPREHDDGDMWCDSGVEVFLNPSGDRLTLLHFIVNADGGFYDSTAYKAGSGFSKGDKKWESGGKAVVEKRANGWKTTITVPLSALGKDAKDVFPAEFCRNRVTKSGKGYGLYTWSPFVSGYDDVLNYGTIETK